MTVSVKRAMRLCWLGGLMTFSASALPASHTDPGLSIRTWQSDDGLPHNAISGIVQSSDGYLWLGTPVGLVSFDGARFESFPFTNSIFADNRQVKVMISSRNGGLWVALERGTVVYLNGERTKVFTRADGLSDNQVHSMTEDADGTVWLIYIGGDHRRITNGRVLPWPEEFQRPDFVSGLFAYGTEGRLWWAKGTEVGFYRDGRLQPVFSADNQVMCLVPAKSNGVWAVFGKHLVRCDAEGHARDYGDFTPTRPGAVNAIVEDSHGNVWIGTALGGLFRFSDGRFEPVPSSHAEIQSLLEDREGNLWVGTAGGGLNRIRPRVMQVQGVESGLPFEVVRSVCEDRGGGHWVTTGDGRLSRQTAQGWKVFENDVLGGNDFSCLEADPRGGLWIGTRQRRVHYLDGDGVRTIEGMRNNTVFAQLAASNGDVWIADLNTVMRLRNGKLTGIRFPGEVRTLRAVVEDTKGAVWVGSARGDLFRAQGNEFVRVDLPEPDSARSIRSLSPMPDGSLWIGYGGQGVGRLKDGRYARVGTEQGLSDDHISHVIPDDYGWVWFGGDRGIFKVRRSDLEAVMEGREKRVYPVRYGAGEGASNLQANFGFWPGAIRGRDGRLWMAMRSGVAVIDPKPRREAAFQTPALLTRATVDGHLVARCQGIPFMETNRAILDLRTPAAVLKLPPNYRRLDLEFTAMSFANVENIRFRYRLRGLDREWFEAGTQRSATYSRLSAGDYVFEVRACNGEGVWNEDGSALAITVLPHFWQTWWFLTMAGVLLLGAMAGGVRYVSFRRLRRRLQLAKQRAALERERSRIAHDLHDSLGADVTEIGLIAESVSLDALSSEAQQDRALTLARRVRALARSLDTVVWTVNPRNDSIDRLASYLCDTFQELFRRSSIRTRIDVEPSIPALQLTPEERSNLFLASKEAMNNVLKHSGATEARLCIGIDGGKFRILIEDDGRGFDLAASHSVERNGLSNMRQRAEEIGGTFQLNSVPGQGTRIAILIAVAARDAGKQSH